MKPKRKLLGFTEFHTAKRVTNFAPKILEPPENSEGDVMFRILEEGSDSSSERS